MNSNKRDEKDSHTVRADEAASLRGERLERKSSEPRVLRNGRERERERTRHTWERGRRSSA